MHLRHDIANAKPGTSLEKIVEATLEDMLPLFYGVYYLKTLTYPETHLQAKERFPFLDSKNPAEVIDGIQKTILGRTSGHRSSATTLSSAISSAKPSTKVPA